MTVLYVGADGKTRRTYNNITSQEVNGTMVVLGHFNGHFNYQRFERDATINLAPGERLEWSKDESERG